MSKHETMSKQETPKSLSLISASNFEFVSNFELRISDFWRSRLRISNFRRRRRRGFSFAEVMFAVIILGIGFIMIAAIFPVAIQQSKLTVDESTAAAIGRVGGSFLDQVATEAVLPPTDLYTSDIAETPATPGIAVLPPGQSWTFPGKVVTFRDGRIKDDMTTGVYRTNMWNAVRGNLILSSDARYAFVPLYKRDRTFRNDTTGALPITSPNINRVAEPAAELISIPVQIQNRTQFDATDTSQLPPGTPSGPVCYNLQPRPLQAHVPAVDSTNTPVPNSIILREAGLPGALNALSEGTFVVVSEDNLGTDPLYNNPQLDGKLNGRVWRLGQRREDLESDNGSTPGTPVQVWEFAPGAEFIDNEPIRVPGADFDYGTSDDVVVRLNKGLSLANVYVIGKGMTDAKDVTKGFDGAAMDIAAYVTYVKVKP
jgi:type II secretory pathway pseudopilin PulG